MTYCLSSSQQSISLGIHNF